MHSHHTASTPSSLPQTQFWWFNPACYSGCIRFCYKESYMYLYLLRHTNVLIVEGQALLDDLLLTKAKHITKFQVEGDSKLMIDANNTKINTSWHLATIVHNVHHLIPWLRLFPSPMFFKRPMLWQMHCLLIASTLDIFGYTIFHLKRPSVLFRIPLR